MFQKYESPIDESSMFRNHQIRNDLFIYSVYVAHYRKFRILK